LTPLLKLAVLDRQKNDDIRNGSNVTAPYIRKYKTAQNQIYRLNKWMEIANLADDEIWKKIDEDGKTKDTLSFKGTDTRPKPRSCS
jgi:hypothetical protein